MLNTVLARLKCWLGKHEPNRHRVHREGMVFTSKCKSCGVPMRKRKGSAWKRDTR
jgi:hypothetical protein